MKSFHELSHPGTQPSTKCISKHYVWHSMKTSISNLFKHCIHCHQSKVSCHTTHLVRQFYDEPTGKFSHVHVDIVGQLPTSYGMSYLLTIVDRVTRWPMVLPMSDMTADSVANAFLEGWVAQFGVPTVITDRGRQFISNLWTSIMGAIGSDVSTTTAFHPQSNGAVERFHRTLKASLMARLSKSSEWLRELPAVLLGIRTAYREELGSSIAEVVLGQEIAVPGQLLVKDSTSKVNYPPHPFFRKIDELLDARRVVPRHGTKASYVNKSLFDVDFVFVRDDTFKKPLTRPYRGPFQVISRSPDAFEIMVRGKPDWVSIDRLKPAFIDNSS